MNTLGRLFRLSIFGESHGECVGITLDGVPAGIPLTASDFDTDIERRKGGTKGTTPRVETDAPQFMSGLFNGHTTGAPLTLLFRNENMRTKDYEALRAFPRPGHADFVATHKYRGFEDYRGGGHFSGRLTVALVAAGVIAKKILKDIDIIAEIVEIGGETSVEAGLQKAIAEKDSIGGIISCTVSNLPIGLGEPFFDSVESVIAHAIFSIPAIKGIEFGAGFGAARLFGSQHNDAILSKDGKTRTNHAGGIVGGISNGNPLVFRVVVKPTSSTPKTQLTLNMQSNEVEPFSVKGRHDLCIALRAPVVIEAVTTIALADLFLLQKNLFLA